MPRRRYKQGCSDLSSFRQEGPVLQLLKECLNQLCLPRVANVRGDWLGEIEVVVVADRWASLFIRDDC